jgi:DNA-binding NarL/FixJ family response regulator
LLVQNEIVPYHHSRVLIADDHPVVREGSSAILRSEEDIKVVVEAADGEETCALYDQLSPDVLLLDLRMPKKDGPQVVAELMARKVSKPRIIVMTAYETEEDIRQALKAGAKAFLVKAAHPQQIREAVRRVAKGERASFRRRSDLNLLKRCPILNSRIDGELTRIAKPLESG